MQIMMKFTNGQTIDFPDVVYIRFGHDYVSLFQIIYVNGDGKDILNVFMYPKDKVCSITSEMDNIEELFKLKRYME